ncbi:Imm51 family immunity protein [Methylobacterium indicum]|uniref:Imm51 family immunity protein n=1 Tax=Methylobacterium indicum TaxID=1775910 RepID=UPI002378EA26|nr:Imm51 family immunity protein [Methylobacterium indicum]
MDRQSYDWQSVATTVLTARHPDMSGRIAFDSSADMFVARGDPADLIVLADAMRTVYHDDGLLTDVLSRAVLD